MTRVLFVCLGNICRSPTAEAVFRTVARREGMEVDVASAGTGDWHIGEGADPRTVDHAERRGYDLSRHRAQQVKPEHFDHYDLVFAMDASNLTNLRRLCPDRHAGKLALFLDHAPDCGRREVPDPYTGGPEAFEEVLDLVETASRGLVASLRSTPRVA
jgi:protein-tyrosine phosphatase